MATSSQLAERMKARLSDAVDTISLEHDELTIELAASRLHDVCLTLRDDDEFKFDQLIDVCGVDYLHYGIAEWATESATSSGFERGVDRRSLKQATQTSRPRFAAVYHLLSVFHNHRIRLRVNLSEDNLLLDTVTDVWASADWFERETFDMYGILFKGHPDLRRILTDYGFIGHPFRKDFPLSGHVEMRYDAKEKRVVYEPVSITPRTLVPKVIRDDSRYKQATQEKGDTHA